MNATPTMDLVFEPKGPMPLGRVMRAYLNEARFDFRQALRTPAFALPFLTLPAALFFLFAVVMAGSSPDVAANPQIVTYLMAGFCTFGAMGPGIFGFGVGLAMEREQGLYKLKRALPVPAGAHLLGKMAMSMAFSGIATGGVLLVALLTGKLLLSAGSVLAFLAVMIVGALPFCAIGMLIGAYASASASPAYANLIYLPGMWLSGMFFPLPESLRPWAVIWPSFHLDQTALGAAGVKEFSFVDPVMTAAVLVAITVLCGGMALRRLARVG